MLLNSKSTYSHTHTHTCTPHAAFHSICIWFLVKWVTKTEWKGVLRKIHFDLSSVCLRFVVFFLFIFKLIYALSYHHINSVTSRRQLWEILNIILWRDERLFDTETMSVQCTLKAIYNERLLNDELRSALKWKTIKTNQMRLKSESNQPLRLIKCSFLFCFVVFMSMGRIRWIVRYRR